MFLDGVGPGGHTVRDASVGAAGSWILALAEMYLLDPHADMYAVFQDDIVVCTNLRLYAERTCMHQLSYWNLYTMPSNESIAPSRCGWYPSNQLGRGAQALVFPRDGVIRALSGEYLWARAQDRRRGHMCIDGGVCIAMRNCGWRELVHNPSLVQHVGAASAICKEHDNQAVSRTFRGEAFDALEMLCV